MAWKACAHVDTGVRVPRGGERARSRGLSLVEVLASLALGALIVGGLVNALAGTFSAREHARNRNEALEQARYAMERMVRAVQGTQRLLIPKPDNPGTAWNESVREPGVLAMTIDPTIDRDGDGFPDADNDRDGRVDEDPGADTTFDNASGIIGIDDNGNGAVDESGGDDDDEDGSVDEDRVNGLDDDGDGAIDEDTAKDMNADDAPGVSGVDDDGDGTVDEGDKEDDDEDGLKNEDWFDPVVFRLSAGVLMERVPVPWDENGSGGVTGADYVERTVAANVTRFRVVRLPPAGTQPPLVQITLDVTAAGGEVITLTRAVRAGGGR